jgi:hypothetical protein
MHPEGNTRGSKETFHCKAVGLSSGSDRKFKLTMLLRTTWTRWITRCKYEVMINGIITDNPEVDRFMCALVCMAAGRGVLSSSFLLWGYVFGCKTTTKWVEIRYPARGKNTVIRH